MHHDPRHLLKAIPVELQPRGAVMPGPRSAMTEAGCWMAGDVLHNPREALVVRIGMGRKASFCGQ